MPPLLPQPGDPRSFAGHTVRVTKLRVIVRCLVTFAIGCLMVVLAIRFGEALWRAVTS
ncbi:hypothetical protein FHX81_2960 [Saccharothrix saharensis]|uniref:Uncharacterized protein n=1 Tax=Saccharothrix saharensis TaxID=571190 RepID=A0A543JCP1_9PSEU|nr:hypothetical protein FHX81_2960 [Saccharothrix saharensis]